VGASSGVGQAAVAAQSCRVSDHFVGSETIRDQFVGSATIRDQFEHRAEGLARPPCGVEGRPKVSSFGEARVTEPA
jgi:hypothetical protein